MRLSLCSFEGEDCALPADEGCAGGCGGFGLCYEGRCLCRGSRGGADCSKPVCPHECSGNGECNTANAVCECNPGWRGPGCETPDCPGEPDCFNRGYCNYTLANPVCQSCEETNYVSRKV